MPLPLFEKVESDPQIRAVTSLAAEIWQEYYIPIIGQAQVEYMLRVFQSETAIREQIAQGFDYYTSRDAQGRMIGYLAVQTQAEKLFLSKIYVHAVARGQGFGRQALAFVDRLAKERGCSAIWLTVNKNNVRAFHVYEQAGFRVAGDYFKEIGDGFVMDDYRMEKPSV